MRTSDHSKSLKVHVFPVAPDYYGDHPLSDWVNMVIADHWHTDNGVRAYIVEEAVKVGVYHRDDILPMIPSMARHFRDVVVHLDPLA